MFSLLNRFEMQRFWNVWRIPLIVRAFLLLAFMVVIMIAVTPAMAQVENRWSPPERINGLANEALTPYLIAGQNHTIHAFTSQPVGVYGEKTAIVYTRWQPQYGWLYPIDILLSPLKNQARLLGAFQDDSGLINIIFFGGDDNEANIYYSKASAVNADKATAWSTPTVVGFRALTPESGAIAGDRDGNLFILFSGKQSGNGVYATHSSDAGETWSDPLILNPTYHRELKPFDLQLYVDSQDRYHVVWSEYNTAGHAESIHYARLEAGLEELEIHTVFEEQGTILSGKPSIIEYENELFLIHFGTVSGIITRFMRRSSDGGKTWTEKDQLFTHVGTNGSAALLIDSNGVMHMFFGNRNNTQSGIVHGMWHSIWQNGEWTEPLPIVSGPKRSDFDPSSPQAVVSHGNLVFLSWMTDTGDNRQESGGTFHSHVFLDAPELSGMPLPLPADEPVATPTATAPPTATATSTKESVSAEQVQLTPLTEVSSDPMGTIFIAIIPVFLFISVIFLVRRINHR